MKRTAILILTIALCFSTTACVSGQKNSSDDKDEPYSTPAASVISSDVPTKESVENQLRVISENSSMWLNDTDDGSSGFAVTDLDHNGRLEIIFSSCQGTGFYSYNQIWEVNREFDAIELCEAETKEGDSQADIMVQSVPLFYDSESNAYYYIFDDLLKNGAAEYYENKRAILLQEGKLLETPLAYKSTIYSDSNSSKITCTDADGKEISEEEYDNIADQFFGKYEKHQVSIGWITNALDPLQDMSMERLLSALKESYNSFVVN
ncbi:hypothetical protein [Lacrimispora sp.]|uniref:hypothetical protein n=1 Tax=Lacrimispora sp. TaxID=2719234 RepID=UPI003460386E